MALVKTKRKVGRPRKLKEGSESIKHYNQTTAYERVQTKTSKKINNLYMPSGKPEIDIKNVFNALYSPRHGIGDISDPLDSVTNYDIYIPTQTARRLYRAYDLLQIIIDEPANEAVREGWNIEIDYQAHPDLKDVGIEKMIADRMEALCVSEKLREALRFSRLFQRGVCFYPVLVEGDGKYDEELNMHDVKSIEQINIVTPEWFAFAYQYDQPLTTSYNGYRYFTIDAENQHISRFIHLIHNPDVYYHLGVSIIDRVINVIKALAIANWSIGQLLLKYHFLLIKFPDSKSERQTNKERIETTNAMRDEISTKSVAGIPTSYDISWVSTSFTGLQEATKFLWEYLCTLDRIPFSTLVGSAQGQVQSGERDQRQWYQRIKSSEQIPKCLPCLRFITNLILHEQQGGIYKALQKKSIDPSNLMYKITFNPMRYLSDLEEEQIQSTISTRTREDQREGIIAVEEARKIAYPDLDPEMIPETDNALREDNLKKTVEFLDKTASGIISDGISEGR